MASQNLIGDRVRKLREARNLTQDQVAGACQRVGWDVSRVTIAKIETGVRVVNDGEIVVLASVLQCTPGDILNPIKVSKAVSVVRQGRTER
jgi:transcriptional regulator with XRE-family HTH domain